jgi:hypothetical protein
MLQLKSPNSGKDSEIGAHQNFRDIYGSDDQSPDMSIPDLPNRKTVNRAQTRSAESVQTLQRQNMVEKFAQIFLFSW